MTTPALSYDSQDFHHSPLLVFWEVTRACDLACRHCRACAMVRPHPRQLETDDALRLIDELTRFPKPPILVLTGGDPLKRADLPQLIRHASYGRLRVAFTPSATPLLTPPVVAQLKNAGISAIALSLDAVTAAGHDNFRGVAGSFDRTLDILRAAASMGLQIQVNTTLTPDNITQLPAMAGLLSGLGIATWSVFFLVPVGRGRHHGRLSAPQYEAAFETLYTLGQLTPFRIKTTEAPHYRRWVAEHVPRHSSPTAHAVPTNDGRGVMFISHTGEIYPSGFLPHRCGQFPDDSPVTVYQQSPVFLALRDPSQLKGKCGVCRHAAYCGGSRARAYAVTGDYLAPEPDCAYQPPAFGESAC